MNPARWTYIFQSLYTPNKSDLLLFHTKYTTFLISLKRISLSTRVYVGVESADPTESVSAIQKMTEFETVKGTYLIWRLASLLTLSISFPFPSNSLSNLSILSFRSCISSLRLFMCRSLWPISLCNSSVFIWWSLS